MNSVAAVLSVLVAVTLMGPGVNAAFNYTCFQCTSATSAYCVQTWGGTSGPSAAAGAPVASNCTCCTKSYDNTYWSRGCVNPGFVNALSCLPSINNNVCFGNNCNTAASLRLPVTAVILFTAVALLLGVYSRQ